jgi:penicillin-binding protein 1A
MRSWSLRASISKRRLTSIFTRRFWIWFGVISLFPISGFLAAPFVIFYLSKALPALENLERIEPPLISRVYDKDTILIHEFYTERRIWTEYKDIPDKLIQAVIAIEDRRFWNHWGVNLRAYPPALMPVIVGKRARGASTLTQQLAKNLFLTPERSVIRKLKEVLLAIKIEQTYTKEEILEFYLNQVYLGGGAYGFQSAAQKYFSTHLDSLSLAQYALLAGLLQRPEAYRPDNAPEKSRHRRDLVLRVMYEERFITKARMVESLTEPIDLKVWNLKSLKAPYFVETIRQYLEKKWNEEFIYGKGVHVYSTLDYKIQEIAEAAYYKHLERIRENLKYRTARYLYMPRLMEMDLDTIVAHWDSCYNYFFKNFIKGEEELARIEQGLKPHFPDSLWYKHAQTAVIVIENETGAIRALIGGEDYEKSKFNRAIQAVRLPGSAFKPIVYSAAIDNGGNPMDSLNDQPVTIPDPNDPEKTWRPKNYDGTWEGDITMRRAFYLSRNLPAIRVAIKYGLRTVVSYARKFGLKHRIPAVPSVGIGTCEATLLEMTSAYTVFPNNGIRPEPYFTESIMDKDHRPIEKHIPRLHETIRPQTSYIMLTMLMDVNIRGTGAKVWAGGFNRHPSGGKTGTTNGETDAWYIGFTKYYTTGVWVGTDDHKPMGRRHTGSDVALPTWLDIMTDIHKELKPRYFKGPSGVVKAKVCNITGMLAGDYCSRVAEDYFIYGRQPQELCNGNHKVIKRSRSIEAAFSSKRKRMRSIPRKGDTTSQRIRTTF